MTLSAVSHANNTAPPRPPVRGLVLAAAAIIVGLLGGFGVWAAVAQLASAVLAPGVVKVETNRKTVQHLDGGIVREILVREGETVRQNQVLLRIDTLDAEMDRNTVRGQIDALLAREARLIAQRDELPEIIFPHALLARGNDAKISLILDGQQRIFQDQRRMVQAEIDVLAQRVRQFEAQIESLHAQITMTRGQVPSIEEELADARGLFRQGLGRKPRVLELERQLLAARGDIATNESRVTALREQIRETEAQMEAVRRRQSKEVSEEVREVQARLADSMEQLRKLEAKADRGDVIAPQDGVVMGLRVTTTGGVVAPGGAVLDLVPLFEKLILEVRISPLDMDVVRPDLPAQVRFVAYKQRTTPTVEGRLVRVAPDAITDEKAGATYFVGAVEVEAAALSRVPHVQLYPGMPVEAAIVTGHRTLLDYVVQPFSDSLAHAFREE